MTPIPVGARTSDPSEQRIEEALDRLGRMIRTADAILRAVQEPPETMRCPVEWERPKSSLCRPHRCDLDEGHAGNHRCDCGWVRRRMARDE